MAGRRLDLALLFWTYFKRMTVLWHRVDWIYSFWIIKFDFGRMDGWIIPEIKHWCPTLIAFEDWNYDFVYFVLKNQMIIRKRFYYKRFKNNKCWTFFLWSNEVVCALYQSSGHTAV